MAKAVLPIERGPPKRTITKKEALRHLVHAAIRMIAAQEDPFATHQIVQSADKLLFDLSEKLGKALALRWDEFVRPEYKTALLQIHRETFNFLKHADKDYDQELFVGEIAHSNVLQLGVCISNYHAIYGEWTEHMQVFFRLVSILSPNAFTGPVHDELRDNLMPKIGNMTLAQFFNSDLWSDDYARATGMKLNAERAQDLLDMREFHDSKIAAIAARAKSRDKLDPSE